ncbi:MAG: 50S ribosomal protein L24 [Acidobacteriia bacterium]|nr:50S ribosomal protein L24 [Terriglobia bacterium]
MAKARVRKNDIVAVISGKDRGKRGRVLRVMAEKGLIMVEGVNVVKRHTRPNPQRNIKGGIVDREVPVHASNVAPIDPETDRPTRVGTKIQGDGQRVRVSRRSGAVLEK